LALIAAIDVPFQVWSHKEKLKMTKQEVKDEFKQQKVILWYEDEFVKCSDKRL